MFVYSNILKKKTLHNCNCPHCKTIKEDNVASIDSLKGITKKDYHFCLHCFGLYDFYQEEKDQIEKLELTSKIKCHYHDETIYVDSAISHWIIFLDKDDSIKLYHKNSNKKDNPDSEIAGYHDQKVNYSTIMEYLNYILEHDEYRKKHPDSYLYNRTKPKRYTQGYKQFIKHKKASANHRAAVSTMNLIDKLMAQNSLAYAN